MAAQVPGLARTDLQQHDLSVLRHVHQEELGARLAGANVVTDPDDSTDAS